MSEKLSTSHHVHCGHRSVTAVWVLKNSTSKACLYRSGRDKCGKYLTGYRSIAYFDDLETAQSSCPPAALNVWHLCLFYVGLKAIIAWLLVCGSDDNKIPICLCRVYSRWRWRYLASLSFRSLVCGSCKRHMTFYSLLKLTEYAATGTVIAAALKTVNTTALRVRKGESIEESRERRKVRRGEGSRRRDKMGHDGLMKWRASTSWAVSRRRQAVSYNHVILQQRLASSSSSP